MAAQVKYRRGNCLKANYTPGSAVAAGDVVVINKVPYVADSDIAANKLGSVSCGGGIYEGTPDAAIQGGKPIWWDDTNNKFTETATSNAHFGYSAPAGSTNGDTLIEVIHAPQAVTGLLV